MHACKLHEWVRPREWFNMSYIHPPGEGMFIYLHACNIYVHLNGPA